MNNIVFIGIRGVGKSSIGAMIAERLNLEFVDTDKVFLSYFPCEHIGEVYAQLGESEFRRVENQILQALYELNDTVIAVGGGAVITEEGRNLIQGLGKVFCLHLQKQEILKRWEKMKAYAQKVEDFDQWYEERVNCLQLVKAVWVDANDQEWIKEMCGQQPIW